MHIMTMTSAVDRLIYFIFTQLFRRPRLECVVFYVLKNIDSLECILSALTIFQRGICSNFIILGIFFLNSEEKSFSIELLIYLIRDHDQLKPFRHVNFDNI